MTLFPPMRVRHCVAGREVTCTFHALSMVLLRTGRAPVQDRETIHWVATLSQIDKYTPDGRGDTTLSTVKKLQNVS